MEAPKQPRFTYNDIFDAIREYHWMIKEVERLSGQLTGFDPDCEESFFPERSRRMKKANRVRRFAQRIYFIDERSVVLDEKEKVLLDCFLDGMRIKDIAEHMRFHRKVIERKRDKIINKIYESQL